ncbi:MAG: DMT family transporter [Dysgonamonadaceae bacterium]|jgi:drug/metabolite transporter (DMT)-like permease|nr:DMT family transporter [Dysgonamonadaceae bacterium]
MSVKLKAIFACILWGSAFAGAKIGFQYAEPVFLSGLRFTLAGILLFPLIFTQKVDVKAQLKHWRFLLLFAFLQTCLQYGLFFMGLNKVPGATSAVIIGTGPLFVAIMAHFTLKDDKLNPRKIIAILLGLSGVVFISLAKGEISSNDPSFYLGVVLLLLSNICGSYTNIMVVKSYNPSPVFLTSFANFTGGVMLLIISFFLESPEIKVYPLEFYGALIWLALIPAVAFSVWYGLLQQPEVKVSDLNMWKFVVPVAGSFLSWLFLPGESPDIASVTGIIIITIALLLLQLPSQYFNKTTRK